MFDWRRGGSIGRRWISNGLRAGEEEWSSAKKVTPRGQSDPWSDPVRMPVPKSVRPLYTRGWESLGIGLGLGIFALTLGYLVLFGF
ncbi:hypothetical protein AFE_1248 [Acidithiobacillus ferrooxidans ATCC 23270]|uniref:Uncharacterized protein n=1 Tax=Acidithiobacillus ferrooxidans (strain ATCC 23270 / DSM 14882 / CIP 104768 / NCIMB 8455) TaxID=243159 RepID=B7J8T0_ACIF2|nr:hypothetical protein AFE_1248 [Acidithiobacillus ferrooxidans ATCC 23270]